jgi:putative transposase
LRLLDWCLMPNHWHFVVWPDQEGQVTAFFRWLTHTHAMRSITHRRVMGMGPLYQGRFKSLPVQEDEHLLTLLRYVQRNPLRAKLARRSGQWRWGSEAIRIGEAKDLKSILSVWPVERPRNWSRQLDESAPAQETETIRQCIRRGRPYGNQAWTTRTAQRLKLGWTLRPRGRPAKAQRDA